MSETTVQLNQWLVDVNTGEYWLASNPLPAAETDRLEPKGAALLALLASQPHQLVDKETLVSELWPGQVVTDDALTRVVSRLRKALGDDPKAPCLVETLPKRGYRLIAATIEWQKKAPQLSPGSAAPPPDEVSPSDSVRPQQWITAAVVLGLVVGLGQYLFSQQDRPTTSSEAQRLVSSADDYYVQMRRQDNEMAIELYQQVVGMRPESGLGQAGLANSLVQQVIRWSNPADEPDLPTRNLHHALREGRTKTTEAKKKLTRALSLAKHAVRLSPNSAKAHKALGFVYSAQQEFELALASYQKAIELDEDAWEAMINSGDVLEISGDLPAAVEYYEQAFEAMGREYQHQSAQIQPWYADMGALIGDKYVTLGHMHEAETWYRHILRIAPFNRRATAGLASVLQQSGEAEAAMRVCENYQQRLGDNPCEVAQTSE